MFTSGVMAESPNLRALFELHATKPACASLLRALRDGVLDGSERTTVDELAGLPEVSRRGAIELLRGLEAAGAGEFKVGRKGHPSRLVWAADAVELAARILDGEAPEPELTGEARGETPAEGAAPELGSGSGEGVEGPRPSAEPAPRRSVSSSGRSAARPRHAQASDSFEHGFHLRRDCEVRLVLPADLSPAEARVLADWVRNLSFERNG